MKVMDTASHIFTILDMEQDLDRRVTGARLSPCVLFTTSMEDMELHYTQDSESGKSDTDQKKHY